MKNTAEHLLLKHFEQVSEAPDAVPRMRRFILDLAVRGKLVQQDSTDEPAAKLLKRIEAEKKQLVKDGTVKAPNGLSPVRDAEITCDIPVGWKWTRLGDSVNCHFGGGTPSKGNSSYWGGDIYWASVKDIGKSKYVDHTIDKITEAGWANSSSNLIQPGNLIVVTRMGLGKVSINRVPVAINQDLRALSLSSLAAIDFYYIFFKTASYEGTGLTVKGIKVGELLNFPFLLPPLAEQHRIVAKVNELMALCDKLESAHIKRESRRDLLVAATLHGLNNGDAGSESDELLPFEESARFYFNHLQRLTIRSEHIQQLRQTILRLAFRGHLVPQNAEDVALPTFSGKAKSKPANFDGDVFRKAISAITLPSNWLMAPLTDVCAAIVDCPHSTPIWTKKGQICVRTNQFRPGYLNLADVRYVSEETYQERIQRLEPAEDDILYSREGGILGVACRVPANAILCLGQRMMLIRSGPAVLPSFLEMLLNSPLITSIARGMTTGGAAPRVNVATVKAYPIPLPPLAEQHRIVAKVNELMALCDKMAAQITKTSTNRRQLLDATLNEALCRN